MKKKQPIKAVEQNAFMRVWLSVQDVLNIKGGAAVGLWTMAMLSFGGVLFRVYLKTGQMGDIPTGVVTAYGLVLTAFVTGTTLKMRRHHDEE